MKLYLAGPMRGIALYNFPAFFDATMKLRQIGHTVANPAERDMAIGLNPSLPLDDPYNVERFDLGEAFEWDFQQITESHGIVLLPGWQESKGVQAELVLAMAMKRSVYAYDEQNQTVLLTDLEFDEYTVEFHTPQECPF